MCEGNGNNEKITYRIDKRKDIMNVKRDTIHIY